MQSCADAHSKKPKRHRTLRAAPTALDSHAQALNLICFAACQEASFACEIHPATASGLCIEEVRRVRWFVVLR